MTLHSYFSKKNLYVEKNFRIFGDKDFRESECNSLKYDLYFSATFGFYNVKNVLVSVYENNLFVFIANGHF